MTRPIFVAANDQHVGKTTTTLALLTAFQRKGMNIGYCKPMGQEFVQIGDACVDKDAALFADIMPFDLEPELHSPVLTASGMTARYIERPSEFVDFAPAHRTRRARIAETPRIGHLRGHGTPWRG
ncbi:MAG: AAA family ATPase [Sphingobacteriales bacterium]|nr:AAA family ATPase [Sphingobacteriales bacterium]